MRRSSISFFVAGLVAASGAFAQSSAPAADAGQAQTPSTAQSQPERSTSHSKSAMQSGHRRKGPTSGNQVQAPSPDTSASARGKHADSAADTGAQAATETRPDARYADPSGQDSQSDSSSHKTKLAAAGSRKDRESGRDQTPEATHSKQATQLGKRKSYTGDTGSKANVGTACSTARPTVDGGVDCGTSGNSATEGKIVTKPH